MKKDESDYTNSFTGDFINEEPVVFKGLTDAEIKITFLTALGFGAPFGVILALLIGLPELIIAFVLIFPIVVVFLLAGWMEKARRGKPPGYIQQKVTVFLIRNRMKSNDITCESYKWSLGRTQKK
ncbi:TIGR03750 family conjugal transfer protein [Pseudoalteromonas sp. GutCa3]|uniref:TIGR03750 family conjugal transfer protein n=1 Tax=Pseudoalteromonas sp. GutCa3 TaxID=888433 RepID=UPI000C343518|nr:TIGR03750 family conjugal transfer protein [Pseudoalteromonas sp. GutCa3]PKG68608.1 TIGR03750 family conjugal transfer protein [Pseudoalteromonas sp. GutCa3]